MNKQVWTLWKQGWNNAPYICKQALKNNIWLNPDWEFNAIDHTSFDYEKLIKEELNVDRTKLNISFTAESDLIRLALLKKYGGLWLDSTVFLSQPLNNWLEESLIDKSFFAVPNKIEDQKIELWCIYSGSSNTFIDPWSNEVGRYWADRYKPHWYFWLASCFINSLSGRNQRILERYTGFNNKGCHKLQFNIRRSNFRENINQFLISCPIHKLTYKKGIRKEWVKRVCGSIRLLN